MVQKKITMYIDRESENDTFFFGGPQSAACEILVPQPGIEAGPLAVKGRSPNHWTAREFL